MTIKETAYETTACIGFPMKETVDTLKATFHSGMGYEQVPSYNIYCLIGGNAEANAVPAFGHPIVIEINEIKRIFVDARPYGKVDTNTGIYIIKNKPEYDLMIARAKLNHIWVYDNPKWLRDVSSVPMALFASFISEAIAKRFALDPREQTNFAILAAIFYNSQFSDDVELDETNKVRVSGSIAKALRVQIQDVISILDNVSVIQNVFELCGKAEEVTGSIRLKGLNPGLLFAVINGTWFGPNNKEMIAISLEHPPTWLAIVLSAYTERTYKNSQISKITERSSFNKAGIDFVNALSRLLKVVEK